MKETLDIALRLSTKGNPCDALIRFATRSDYSHVDFILPTGEILGAHPLYGVRRAKLNRVAREMFLVARDAPRKVLDVAQNEVGKPYDFLAVFSQILLSRNWQSEESWFCSELVAWCFEKAGDPLFPERIVRSRVTPRDLLFSDRLERITREEAVALAV